MINKFLSDKLKAISFLLMLMVVFTHSFNLEVNFSSETSLIVEGYNSFIQIFICKSLTRIVAPLFFIISGYLFFLSFKKPTSSEFFSKLKSRSKTLLLPYLLWSIFGLLFYLVLQLIPFSKPFFTNELIVDYSVNQLLSRIFINPIPYQLWFIRDLIVLLILSPILYGLIKVFKFYVLLIFLITWVFEFNFVLFSNEALLFFTVGFFLSLKGINLQQIKTKKQNVLFSVIWISLITIRTSLIYLNIENEWLIRILDKSGALIGILSIWLLYDVIFEKTDISKTKYYSLFQYSFIIYVFHEPILTIIKKAFYYILGQSELSSFLNYISAATITVFICILIGFLAKKIIPKFYYLSTGGR